MEALATLLATTAIPPRTSPNPPLPPASGRSELPWPAYARIPLAGHLSGLSRSGLYREIAAGNIRAVKHGNATLIDMASVRQFLDALPVAAIRVAA